MTTRRGNPEIQPTDEIAVLKVEPVELVTSLLGVHDIIINNVSGSLGVLGDSLADLATMPGQFG